MKSNKTANQFTRIATFNPPSEMNEKSIIEIKKLIMPLITIINFFSSFSEMKKKKTIEDLKFKKRTQQSIRNFLIFMFKALPA